jgi:hypothetical protein
MNMVQRLADRVDLAIDILTLGQYGLETCDDYQASARDAGCGGGGHLGCREALPPARRRGHHSRGRPAITIRPQPAA